MRYKLKIGALHVAHTWNGCSFNYNQPHTNTLQKKNVREVVKTILYWDSTSLPTSVTFHTTYLSRTHLWVIRRSSGLLLGSKNNPSCLFIIHLLTLVVTYSFTYLPIYKTYFLSNELLRQNPYFYSAEVPPQIELVKSCLKFSSVFGGNVTKWKFLPTKGNVFQKMKWLLL